MLQTIGVDLTGWLVLGAIFLGPGVVALLLWSPLLVSSRLRSLFRELPPRGSLLVTYPVVMLAGSAPFVLGTVYALVQTTDTTGAATSNALLGVILPVSLLYLVGVPVVGGVVLPRFGVDWDPTGYGPITYALLLLGGAWYAAVFAVPLVLLAAIMAMPT